MPANLPVYKCMISEDLDSDLQVEFMALVDKPAIDKNFMAFKEKLCFSIDADKKIVSGPAMIADALIYRNDPDGFGEYYITFSAADITSIVQKFFKKGFMQNFNIMHDSAQKLSGVTIYESFITDEARGIKAPLGYEDVANGSWFITAKVDDDATWEKVKSGEVKGFSVEGVFRRLPVKMHKIKQDEAVKRIKAILENMES